MYVYVISSEFMAVLTIKSTYVFIRVRSQNSPTTANAILWRPLATHNVESRYFQNRHARGRGVNMPLGRPYTLEIGIVGKHQ